MSVIIASAPFWADWPNSRDTAFDVRAVSTQSWYTAEGELVAANASRVVGTGTISALRPTIPQITLPATSAGVDNQSARWTVTLHRTGKADALFTVLDNFPLNIGFEPVTTWGAIRLFKNNGDNKIWRDTEGFSRTDALNFFNQQVNASGPATTTTLGTALASVAPADPLLPKFVSDNDPRVAQATTSNRGTTTFAASGEVSSSKAVRADDARISVVRHVATYGAVGDGNPHPLSDYYATLAEAQADYPTARALTDQIDRVAIQKAIDSLTTVYGGTVQLAGGGANYLIDYPLINHQYAVRLRGGGSLNETRLTAYNAPAGMPVYISIGPYGAFPTTTALATGSGVAMALSSSTDHTINARDFSTMEINGLAAFCLEFYVRSDTDPGSGYLTIWNGRGSRTQGAGPVNTIFLSHQPGQALRAQVTIAGAEQQIDTASGTFTTGITHHVAVTHDGTTLRVFIDGTVRGTAAAAGTLTQTTTEDFSVGRGTMDTFPEGFSINPSITGAIDSIRFSNTARYTANFTAPTAKLSSDANTLYLQNFDDIYDNILKVRNHLGTGYQLARIRGLPTLIGAAELSDLWIAADNGIGVCWGLSPGSRIANIRVAGRIGVLAFNNNFHAKFENLFIEASRMGFVLSHANHLARVQKIQIIISDGIGFVSSTNDSVSIDTVHIDGNAVKIPYLIRDTTYGPIVLKAATYGDEGQTVAPLASFVFSRAAMTMVGGGATNLTYSLPVFEIDGGQSVTMTGVVHHVTPSVPHIMKVVVAPTDGISLTGCSYALSTGAANSVPWADSYAAVNIWPQGPPVYTPAQITADRNNYNPGSAAYLLRLSTDASRTLTGLTCTLPQYEGQEHTIVNVGSNNLVLAHESGSSSAANRFHNTTGADITLAADQQAVCRYDATTARWRCSKFN